MNTRRAGLWAMGGQTLLAGIGYSFARTASQEFDPFVLTLLRMSVTASLFGITFFLRGGFGQLTANASPLTKAAWMRLAGLAVLGVTLNQFLFLCGMKFTTPANSALIYAITPLFVLIIAVFILRSERLTLQKGIGIAVALAGVSVVLFARGNKFDAELMLGNILILGAVCCWASYISLGKKVIGKFDTIQATALLMMLGAVIYAPVGLWRLFTSPWHAVSVSAWIGFWYITLLSSAASYLLLTFAMSRLESSQVSVFMNAQPVVAAAFSAAVYGEVLSLNLILGGLVAITGIYVMTRPSSSVAVAANPRTTTGN
ncbi:MAG: DMT family transporter [Rhizobacter sp.]|nr:DMT family transporter [Chlorobiales bacterium]